jgi:hypothetical protein
MTEENSFFFAPSEQQQHIYVNFIKQGLDGGISIDLQSNLGHVSTPPAQTLGIRDWFFPIISKTNNIVLV